MNSSSSKQKTSSSTQDQRQAVEGGTALNSGGGAVKVDKSTTSAEGNGIALTSAAGSHVSVNITPNAAFDLAKTAIQTTASTLGAALENTQTAAQSDNRNIADTLLKIGLPVAGLVIVMKGMK